MRRSITGFALCQKVGGLNPSRLRQVWDELAAPTVALNDKAVKAVERRVSEVVRAAGEQRAQAKRELVDALQTVDDLEAKLDQAKLEAEELEKKLAEQSARTTSAQHAAERARMNERPNAHATSGRPNSCTPNWRPCRPWQKPPNGKRNAWLRPRQTATRRARKLAAAREEAAQLRGQVKVMQS